MSKVSCKRCSGSSFVRSGFVRGHQRYRCKDCGCHFTDTPPRGKPAAMKALAVLPYAMGNASYGMIARLFGVSVTIRPASGSSKNRHRGSGLPDR